MTPMALDLSLVEKAATEVAAVLRALANERRLMVLCELAGTGEASVGQLAKAVELSQSALSQHLAKMREEGLIEFRREGQTLWYRISDPRIEQVLAMLQRLYCSPGKSKSKRS